MARRTRSQAKLPIESYDHRDKERLNNPPVGLVTPDTDRDSGKKTYAYDPHLDPQLQWAGKAEHTSFEVPTVSLHVHERIDPRTIIEAVRRRNGNGAHDQPLLFEMEEENPPVRDAIEFYKHSHNWTNRLVSGDSLLVMNSLLKKEGMAGKVQMVYIDPPYGIRYGSNFQPFVNRRDVRDGRDEDLTQEPETIKAFRDTWELGIHSYLSYLRDRLLLAREMLTESGSCFVQIGEENVHRVRAVMDEVFGDGNFVVSISVQKTGSQTGLYLQSNIDYILWYRKSQALKFRPLFLPRELEGRGGHGYTNYQIEPGVDVSLASVAEKIASGDYSPDLVWRSYPLTSEGFRETTTVEFQFNGQIFSPGRNRHWGVVVEDLERAGKAGRLIAGVSQVHLKRFFGDSTVVPLGAYWNDLGGASGPIFVVQTNVRIIERCILMSTDPGDLVFDPTCGSGTTAYVAEQWGRRWITCDTSRVAVTLAQQRLMTASFDYYELAHPDEGVGSGFNYKMVPHITLRSIVNNPDIDGIWKNHQEKLEALRTEMNAALGESWEEWEVPRDSDDSWSGEIKEVHHQWWEHRLNRQKTIDDAIARHAPQETLYDQPQVDNGKRRVTGPFSVEAVPAPSVRPIVVDSGEGIVDSEEPLSTNHYRPSTALSRSGETLRQSDWRDELMKTGIRAKAGQYVRFARLEPLPGCRHLHADGETLPNDDGPSSIREGAATSARRVVVSFGPDHAPLEQRQVAQALEEAHDLVPRPKVIVFAAFQFDPEAAKDIDETNWPGIALLKAQMNADLLTDDLKKKRASNQSFWLIGQPDVLLHQIRKGHNIGKWQVYVRGFDYYNTKTGNIESGGEDKIAMWMLDTDYDGRSLYPRQVFFPMAGSRDGWNRLARNLKAEIDEDLIEAYQGTVSLPFEEGENRRIAVKIVDDRGIESLRIMPTAGR